MLQPFQKNELNFGFLIEGLKCRCLVANKSPIVPVLFIAELADMSEKTQYRIGMRIFFRHFVGDPTESGWKECQILIGLGVCFSGGK